MALKRFYEAQSDIPEGLEDYYIERDGRWVLDAEAGEGEKTAEDVRKAMSARDHEKQEAEKLRKQLRDLQSKLGDIDPDRLPEAKEALERLAEMEHKQLIDEKKYEEAAQKKYERQIAELNRQLDGLKTEIASHAERYDSVLGDLRESRINSELQKALIEQGANPELLEYVIAKEATKWELDPETRQPVPIEMIEGGRTKVTAMGSDGKPLTMKEHAATILKERPSVAIASAGSGSSHQTNTNNGASRFTMKRDEARMDNRKYERLSQEAAKQGAELVLVD